MRIRMRILAPASVYDDLNKNPGATSRQA